MKTWKVNLAGAGATVTLEADLMGMDPSGSLQFMRNVSDDPTAGQDYVAAFAPGSWSTVVAVDDAGEAPAVRQWVDAPGLDRGGE